MPIGITTDICATFAGGLIGCFLGSRLSDRWKSLLNNLMGVAALVMGIVLILRVHTLSASILALIVGAIVAVLRKIRAVQWRNKARTCGTIRR